MNNIMTVLYSLIPFACFFMGFVIGLKICGDGKTIQIKTPSQVVKDKKVEKEFKKTLDEQEQYIANLENYPYNQVEFKNRS